MPGTLYIVATPIGNLEDITLRALRILREVDLIACEDTRQSAKLLSHFEIEKPRVSYHEHNELERANLLLAELNKGNQIALLSDAGTPCISDPGYRIVRTALDHGIRVVPIPGPCSLIAALSASGRPTDSFTFLGFLPPRTTARRTVLESIREEHRTVIFFESPQRLLDTLADVREILGARALTIAREITKIYEEMFSGSVEAALVHFSQKPVKGEIVLILEKEDLANRPSVLPSPQEIEEKMRGFVERMGMTRNEALKEVARQYHLPKRTLYKLLLGSGSETK
ncbi:MAG: 16S rRNA (cytidine(1402)-2'-O)-methyltransferase [Terriglobia bacterium]